MKHIKYQFSLICALVLHLPLYLNCQTYGYNCMITDLDSCIYEENLTGEFFNFTVYDKGAKLLNNDWYRGEILLEKGSVVKNQHFNIHLATGQLIWFRTSDSKLVVIDKTTVKECKLFLNNGNGMQLFRKVVFRPYNINDTVTTFLQVLTEGYLNLFAHRKIKLANNQIENIRDDKYYLKVDSGKYKPFKNNRWLLYAMVPKEKRPLIKKIVRTNHLIIRREIDLIKALELFNSQVVK